MSRFAFERETTTNNDDTIAHTERFMASAADALASADLAEGWNAAMEYAQAQRLTAREMTRILAILQKQHRVTASLVRSWCADGAQALGEAGDLEGPSDCLTNRSLQAHATGTSWRYRDVIRDLCTWVDRFNSAFFSSRLPPPVLSVERMRLGMAGSYQCDRDGMGLRHRITLNAIYLDRGENAMLETLLHELVHEWEEVDQGRKRGGAYHSTAFRAKAQQLGIPTDERGRSLGAPSEGRFARLLAQCGLDASPPPVGQPKKTVIVPRTKLRRWFCGCTNIWAANGTTVAATCESCHSPFAPDAREPTYVDQREQAHVPQ